MKRGKVLSARSTAQMVSVTSLAKLWIWSRRATLSLWYLHSDISAAVATNVATPVYLVGLPPMFCCSNIDLASNSCVTSTHGSSSPFTIEAGNVIFNRTNGSTSPNSTETSTVVVTSTVTALSDIVMSRTVRMNGTAIDTATYSQSSHVVLRVTTVPENSTSRTTTNNVPTTDTAIATQATACSQSSHIKSSSPSSRADIAIASSVSALLGLGLLVTLGFFWRLRKQRQTLSRAVQTWKLKYSELMESQAVTFGVAEHQTPYQLHGWHPDELDGQPHLPAQLGDGNSLIELKGDT